MPRTHGSTASDIGTSGGRRSRVAGGLVGSSGRVCPLPLHLESTAGEATMSRRHTPSLEKRVTATAEAERLRNRLVNNAAVEEAERRRREEAHTGRSRARNRAAAMRGERLFSLTLTRF